MRRNNIFRLIVVALLVSALPFSIYLLGKQTYFSNRAYTELFGTKANLVVNLTDSAFTPTYPWSNFSQGGEEKKNMLSPVLAKVSLLEPSYIRVDHIYDFYDVVGRDAEGNLKYDWAKLDEVITAISGTGAKPFISLSYMSREISSGSEVDIPVDWNEWKEVVRETVEHISGRGGLAIENVYYEVWNEPDLFGKFRLYGAKNYLTLYKYAQDGALEAKDTLPFKIGGPATTGLYKTWFKTFFDFARKDNLRVDFYSWHRYSKNILEYEEDILSAQSWILDYPEYKGVEFVISEAGFSSDPHPDYDTEFSAVHTISMYVATFTKISKVFSFEIKDGPGDSKLRGGWGILAHESFGEPLEKPRYRAFEFLNLMRGRWYPVYSQGTWVKAIATTNGKIIRILVVNYDPFKRHFENVPITLVNLPFGRFTFRRIDFLGGVREYSVETINNNWSTLQLFEPNTAAIFEVVPR